MATLFDLNQQMREISDKRRKLKKEIAKLHEKRRELEREDDFLAAEYNKLSQIYNSDRVA